MKKNILAVLIASSIGLAGCGNESEVVGNPTIDPIIERSLKADTKIKFDILSNPSAPIVVKPTYLAVDKNDGTLATEGLAADPTKWSDPLVTMGKTDGWSTNQPITIEFIGNNLDSTTAADGFYLLETGDPTSSTYANTQPVPLTEANGDFKVFASGKTLTVLLTKPLKPASQYQFAITSDLKDINGNEVGMSNSYAVLKSTTRPPSEKLEPAQRLARASEATFAATGVDKNKIIFTNWFTTASAGDVLFAGKAASALALKNGASTVWQGSAIADNVDLSKVYNMDRPTFIQKTVGGNNDIYTGSVYLPYFLETAADKFSTTPWQSGMPSLAAIKYILGDDTASSTDKAIVMQKLTSWGITLDDLEKVSTDPAVQLKVLPLLTGKTITLSDGSQLDSERLITRYSPVPKLKSVQEVEYTLILPADNTCKAAGKNTVSIYQHGITANKEELTTSSLADTIIGSTCNAIFAIDLPLHGTRGVTIPGVGNVTASTKPEIFLNLETLPVGRDNLRQSVMDQINLRVAIGQKLFTISKGGAGTIDELGWLNPANGVSFIGHSLGAMTGVALGNVANRPLGTSAADQQSDALFFNINKLALANPGAGIPYLLMESGEYGNFVKGALLAGSSAKFKANCDAQTLDYKTCYTGYEASLLGNGDPTSIATLTEIYKNFSNFAYAAQTILDTVDPLNHAPQISSGLPVYLSMVKDDSTIPTQLTFRSTVTGTSIAKPYSVFGGTLPLVDEGLLNLTVTDSNVASLVKHVTYFTAGDHGSQKKDRNAANPDAATGEMQDHIADLVNGDGNSLSVPNTGTVLSATLPDPSTKQYGF
ncbi:VolA/Pla-1 family phospholipase [Photobacterium alginatilyticum]|uniref:Lipase n=1 Tax=Photobacterium alginatilyticum TaxID=1775171 RepID=A0ABW9YCM6_9GAMM|nr:VolA/Pla-1 family phospholipase [Photobacterium alginatilyticum]NBI51487.1 lipase [Photobacterium alginatilyticum]